MTFTGIKKATGQYNQWPCAAAIYLDKSNGKIWCERYEDANTYIQRTEANENIVLLFKKSRSWDPGITMLQIKDSAIIHAQ